MEAGVILKKAKKYSIERWNYHSPTTIIDYTAGFKAAIEMMEKTEVKNLVKPDVSSTFCTCGNPSKQGYINMVNDEEMIYFCADCKMQVQN